MARPTKRRIDGTTSPGAARRSGNPKVAAQAAGSGAGHRSNDDDPHSRYTPPIPGGSHAPSPMWVPVVMFAFLGLGFLVIFLNYTDLLPGAPNGWYLIGGLGGILAGIMTATQLR